MERYSLDDSYLLKPDRKGGRPGILSGANQDGHPVLVRAQDKPAAQVLREFMRAYVARHTENAPVNNKVNETKNKGTEPG